MSRIPHFVAAGCLCCSLLLFSSVSAQSVGLARSLDNVIQVDRGATCLEKSRVVAQVRMWIGREINLSGLRVTLTGDPRTSKALAFEIRRGEHSRKRAFKNAPTDCNELHAVVGLAVALAIDATVLQAIVGPGRDASSAKSPATPPATPPLPARLAVLASLGSDVLPGLSLGFKVDGELGLLPWLSGRFEVLAHHGRNHTIATSQGHFNSSLLAGALQLCAGGPLQLGIQLSLCTGPAVGALRVAGQGYSPNRTSTGLWFAVESGVRIEAELGLLWVLDLNVISAVISPPIEATRGDGSLLSRAPSSTGFAASLGPCIAF